MKTIPDKWVIVKISKEGEETIYKVFASWAGGYLRGNSWRLNSGIKSIYKEDGSYRITGYSGSHYVCNENYYGVIGNSNRAVLDEFIERGGRHGYSVEVLPEDFDFLKIGK